MGLPLRILFIEDSADDMLFILRAIRRFGYDPEVRRAETQAEIEEILRTWIFDLIISDFSLPLLNGLDSLNICHQFDPDIPFLVVSGEIGEEIAVQMMKAGAHDYIMKNNLTRLGAAIERELREAVLRRVQHEKDRQIFESQQMLAGMFAQIQLSNLSFQQFVDAAYHDLQEPLRKIMVFSDLLTTKYASGLDERALETSQKILSLAGKMQALIQSVLSYTQLDATQQIFVKTNLGVEIKKAVDQYIPHIRVLGGTIELDDLPDIDVIPQTIPTLFEILIDNSVRYAKSDIPTHIKISSVPIQDQTSAPGKTAEQVNLIVEDNGIGFEEKYAEKIFEPFTRLAITEHADGSGVGLAIARRIVMLHNGSISAKSKPGQGAIISIQLPIEQSRPVDKSNQSN